MNKQEEKLLREFVRKTFVKKILQEQKKAMLQEQKVRLFVRSLIREVNEEKTNTVIFEGKEVANPHPNTGINKLRDAIRKAKPSIKSKFLQLTSSKEQRDSFRNHLLAAFVRLFEQLDALSANQEAEAGLEDAIDSFDAALEEPGADVEAPPEEEMDAIESDIEDLLENILREFDIVLEQDEDSIPEDLKKYLESGEIEQYNKIQSLYNKTSSKYERSPEDKEEMMAALSSTILRGENDTDLNLKRLLPDLDRKDYGIYLDALENDEDPFDGLIRKLKRRKENDLISKDREDEKSKNLSQVEKDVEKKKAQEREREEFGAGMEGDATGRNQAYDTFNLVQSYFSDAYLDLDSPDDREMFKKWCLYNLKLLLDSYEEQLAPQLQEPDIQNPQ